MNLWIVNVYRRAWNVPRTETYLSGIMGGSHFYIHRYFINVFFLASSWNSVALRPQLYMFCTLFFFFFLPSVLLPGEG